MSEHLPLALRKILTGRIAAVKLHAAGGGSSNTDTYLDKVRDRIFELSNLQFADGSDAEPLDDWLVSITTVLRSELPTMLNRRPPSPEMTAMVDALEAYAAAISCMVCGKGKICNGSAKDSIIVARNGQCMADISVLFNAASDIAEAYYSAYAPASRNRFARGHAATLATANEEHKPHSLTVNHFVAGRAEFIDSTARAATLVTLIFCVRSLDWETYLATLYVLLHEFICHAFAGLDGGRPRPELGEYDAFAEGWMDRIVTLILDDLRAGAGPAFPAAAKLDHISRRADLGKDYHSARLATSAIIRRGQEAADGVYRAIQSLPNVNPREAFYRLSFEINSIGFHRLSVEQRGMLARRLRDLFRDGATPQPETFIILRYLREYLDNRRSVTQLLAELLPS